MAQQLADGGLEYSSFLELVHSYFPHVKLPKNSRLGKCLQCSEFIRRKLKATSITEASKIAQQRTAHLTEMFEERQAYSSRAHEAKTFPHQAMSVIIDQSDAIQLPAVAYYPKAWIKLQKRMPMHVGGLIDHWFGNRIYFHPQPCFGKGANLTISILHNHLQRRFADSTLPRPPLLYLQLDNCSGENKNRYVFGYLSYLIHRGIFQEIYINFLPVGHTHEDIDRLFSVLPDFRTKWECFHPDDFPSLLKQAYASSDPAPEFIRLPWIYDWKSWLSPYLNQIEHHSQPRQFHLFRCGGEVMMTASTSALVSNPTEPRTLLPFPPVDSLPLAAPFLPMKPEVFCHHLLL